MRDLWHGLIDLLLPASCVACGAAAQDVLCHGCSRSLPRIAEAACRRCQARDALPGRARCAVCEAAPGHLEACVAGCRYEGPAATWIRALKYPSVRSGLANHERTRLRGLAQATLALAPPETPDAVVPVPLHPTRLRSRGFNQALTFARQLAAPRALRVLPTALERVRDTPHQTGLSRHARRRNLRGAFRATRRVPPRLWLVDDVVTTGTTLEEAARTLRRAGAKHVVALCAARTILEAS